MVSRGRLVALLVACAVLMTACQAAVDVSIDVNDDGSGTVTVDGAIDADGARQITNINNARFDDLIAAGWQVDGPTENDEGGRTFTLSKGFSTPDQLGLVMDELTGSDGLFQDFGLEIDESFGESSIRVTGTIDPTRGINIFSDADVAAALGGQPFGRDIAEIEEQLGTSLDDAVNLRLIVRLPGDETGGSGEVFDISLASTEVVDVDVSAENDDLVAKLWRWGAIAAAILFVVSVFVAIFGFVLDRRAKKRQPKVKTPEPVRSQRAAVAVGAGGPPGTTEHDGVAPAAPPRPQRKLRLVVVDPVGVIFNIADDASDLLVPFVRELGSEATDSEVEEAYRQATLGRTSTAELWRTLGLEEDPAALDDRYLSYIRLRNGAKEFLKEMARRQMPVASVSNEVIEWSRKLRVQHGLEAIEPWILSGEVGVRKPDPGIYEALRRSTGVPYESCLMIDTRVTSLDAAKTLGMSTAWFTTTRPPADQRPNHPIVTSFSDFFRRRVQPQK